MPLSVQITLIALISVINLQKIKIIPIFEAHAITIMEKDKTHIPFWKSIPQRAARGGIPQRLPNRKAGAAK
jgi:hypothetical protein